MSFPFGRSRRLLYFLAADLAVFAFSLFAAYLLRFNGAIPADDFAVYSRIVLVVAGLKILAFALFQVYSQIWVYMNLTEVFLILAGLGSVTALLVAVSFFQRTVVILIPRSVMVMDLVLSFLFAAGYRVLINRVLRNRFFERIGRARTRTRSVLIYGAGEAGSMVLREVEKYPDLGLRVVGFLDDNPEKWGFRIGGRKVLGGLDRLVQAHERFRFNELVIAMPSAPGRVVRSIIDACAKLGGVEIKIVPGTKQIIRGEVRWDQIRDVKLEDLLGREEVRLADRGVFGYLGDRRVLVTGAGGSIGSELVRQILRYKPKSLLLLGRGENSIYEIETEIRRADRVASDRIVPLIADIRDADAMAGIFARYRPEIVFHAAAHKHVPLMEHNPREAFKNNVVGSLNLMRLSSEHKTERFVLISTDKAVNPTSVMGASKRVAEIVMQEFAARHPQTKFSAVRFGNVLGSRGSVIPLFKRQIQEGGPVTVTHKDVTRFFMTIPEAANLVMQSAGFARGGEIFILSMGEPVKIYELAVNLIRLSGLRPHEDIEIKVTGLRPGEKLYEEVLTETEGLQATRNEKILVARPGPRDQAILREIQQIAEKIDGMDDRESRQTIFRLARCGGTFKP